jgi:hypothetical protein
MTRLQLYAKHRVGQVLRDNPLYLDPLFLYLCRLLTFGCRRLLLARGATATVAPAGSPSTGSPSTGSPSTGTSTAGPPAGPITTTWSSCHSVSFPKISERAPYQGFTGHYHRPCPLLVTLATQQNGRGTQCQDVRTPLRYRYRMLEMGG